MDISTFFSSNQPDGEPIALIVPKLSNYPERSPLPRSLAKRRLPWVKERALER